MKTMTQDIIVVGGGIIGTSCALALQQAGQSVLLLDREAPGAGASSGNAGHIATEQVFPLASTEMLLQLPKMLFDPLGPLSIDWRYLPQITPWMLQLVNNMRPKANKHSADALSTLNRASLTAWRDLLESINRSDLLQEKGSLLVYEKPETKASLLKHIEKLSAYDVPVAHLNEAELHEQAPAVSKRLLGALEFPATAHVTDPLKLVDALFEAAQQQGMAYSQTDVTGGRLTEAGVELETTDGTLLCKRVLIANGAYAKPLVQALTGVKVPLETERGYHLMLPNELDTLPVAISSAERRFIMTPMQGGLRLAGTVEFAGLEREANMKRAMMLQQHAQALFDRPLNTEGSKPWMGRRPSLPDSLPVIDRTGPKGEVLLAFGHQHLGLTQAALTAQLITQLYLSREPTYDPAPYSLSRF